MIHLHHILGVSKLYYLNDITFQYNLWCEWLSTKYYVPMIKLQQNKSLYTWFIDKYQSRILEPFYVENKDYIEADVKNPKMYRTLLRDFVKRPECNMMRAYPKPLIKAIITTHNKTLNEK